jgi:hypothetical protein
MTNIPLHILQELHWAEKQIDRRGDRDVAVQRSNRIRDRFNEIAYGEDTFSEVHPYETVFLIPNKKYRYSPHGEVNVLSVEKNSEIIGWIQKARGNVGLGGFAYPFDTDQIWSTKEKATRAGIGQILMWALRNVDMRETKSGQAENSMLIAECRNALKPKRLQQALF